MAYILFISSYMKPKIIGLGLLFAGMLLLASCQKSEEPQEFNSEQLMIRVAELSIDPDYLQQYLSILKEEAAASVRLEPGVICIYPMFEKENPTKVRILEVYTSEAAYEKHLQTPHFKKYKSSTLNMVKSLKLVDMASIDPNSIPGIFAKLQN